VTARELGAAAAAALEAARAAAVAAGLAAAVAPRASVVRRLPRPPLPLFCAPKVVQRADAAYLGARPQADGGIAISGLPADLEPYNTRYAPAEASAGGYPGYASAAGQRLCYSPSYDQWVLDSKRFDPADNTCVAAIDAKVGLGRMVALYIPLLHVTPYSLTYKVPLFLKQRCGRTVREDRPVTDRRARVEHQGYFREGSWCSRGVCQARGDGARGRLAARARVLQKRLFVCSSKYYAPTEVLGRPGIIT
jgi:hypothetical protein